MRTYKVRQYDYPSSGVGGGGAGGASALPKVLICQKYEQNP